MNKKPDWGLCSNATMAFLYAVTKKVCSTVLSRIKGLFTQLQLRTIS